MVAILPFILRYWKLIVGGLITTGLVIALMLANADARHWKKLDEQHVAALHVEVLKNGINLTSIDTLTKALAEKNAESLARAKAFDDAKAADAATIAAMDKRFASTKAARDALMAMSRTAAANPACKVPVALSGALSGL